MLYEGMLRPGMRVRGRPETANNEKTGMISARGYIQVKPAEDCRRRMDIYSDRMINTWGITWDGSEKEELVDEDQLDVI
jgi:hypothetical protein